MKTSCCHHAQITNHNSVHCSLLIVLCSLFFLACSPKVPVIDSINPQIGAMGEPVTIRGTFFGKDRKESYVSIAGVQPTTMSYLSWQDNEIILRLPEFGEAGLVYVYVNGRKSNGALFANQATLPIQVRNDQEETEANDHLQ